jgi:hypothetical protein
MTNANSVTYELEIIFLFPNFSLDKEKALTFSAL